jgi:hypothetical protein
VILDHAPYNPVIDRGSGNSIAGLYAAGTVVNGAFGKPYKAGAVTTCSTTPAPAATRPCAGARAVGGAGGCFGADGGCDGVTFSPGFDTLDLGRRQLAAYTYLLPFPRSELKRSRAVDRGP